MSRSARAAGPPPAPRLGRLLFIDASAGASGDMILGGLVDLGVPLARIRDSLRGLPIDGWTIRSRRVVRCGLSGRKVDVGAPRREPPRTWGEIERILRRGALAPPVLERSLAVFRRLVEAEAAAHGSDLERVHLHEAGATDAIIDVVGSCTAIEHLAPSRIVVSPMTTGYGTVRCAHGTYPVPGPATLRLLRGHPAQAGEVEGERLTPTGAALLTTLAGRWGQMPPMRPRAIGYGAGDREFDAVPNMLRMVLGDAGGSGAGEWKTGAVAVLDCNVDDSTPQALAEAMERLLAAGALDAFVTAVSMKKGRPGHLITAVCRPERIEEYAELLFRHTSTLGIRHRIETRFELERRVETVTTPFGAIRVKVARTPGAADRAWPEFDDCVQAARISGASVSEVQHAVLCTWRSQQRITQPTGSRRPLRRGRATRDEE